MQTHHKRCNIQCDNCSYTAAVIWLRRNPFIAFASHHKYNIATGASLLGSLYCSIHRRILVFLLPRQLRTVLSICRPFFTRSLFSTSFGNCEVEINFPGNVTCMTYLCRQVSRLYVEIDSLVTNIFFGKKCYD